MSFVSQLFLTDILLIPVYSCSFVDIFLTHPSLYLATFGSFLCNSSVFMFVCVAFVLVHTDSCQFVPHSWHVLPASKYWNISRTSRMGLDHYKNAVITC